MLFRSRDVIKTVREGRGPHFVDADTYRFMGHSMADPAHGHYRTKEEVERERARDPIVRLQNLIRDKGLAKDEDFKTIEKEVGATVAKAVRFADESPFPKPEALHEDVLVEGDGS